MKGRVRFVCRGLYLAWSFAVVASLPGCILDLSGLTGSRDDEAESGTGAGIEAGDDATDAPADSDEADLRVDASEASVDAPGERAVGDAPDDAPLSDARDEDLDAPTDGDAPDGLPACDAIDTSNGHCYYGIATAKWSVARDNCVKQGAHLVTIASPSEQAIVATVLPISDKWIGYSQSGSSPFVWVTREGVSFENWGPGEPNDNPDACGRMLATTGIWSDQKCTNYYNAVCEREP